MTIYHDQDGERPERLGTVLDLRMSMIRASGSLAGDLPRRPGWAAHSVVEDGGVTHEYVSGLHPLTLRHRLDAGTAFGVPTDVSVSVFDRPSRWRWVRQPPQIQVEGGSYPLAEALVLVRAIEELTARLT
jgi:hypothetical protein